MAVLSIRCRAAKVRADLQSGDWRRRLIKNFEREPSGLVLVAKLGLPATFGLTLRRLNCLVVIEPTLIGIGLVTAAKGGDCEVEKDCIGDKHDAEKGDEADEHMAAFDHATDSGSRCHRPGPWNVVSCSASVLPSTEVTTK